MSKTLAVGNSRVARKGGKDNTGNLMHAIAARNLLKNYDDYNVGRLWTDEEVEFIKEKYDNILFIAANTIRPTNNKGYLELQKVIASNLKRVKLPVVTIGLGSQAKMDDVPRKVKLASATIDLMNVISDFSLLMGVRGEFTSDVLKYYGINNSVPMGCPSVYYWVTKEFKYSDLLTKHDVNKESKILFNYTSLWREYPIFSLAGKFKDAFMIGQMEYFEEKCSDFGMMKDDIPDNYNKLFVQNSNVKKQFSYYVMNRFKKFYDLEKWMSFARDFSLSIGSRFHGNMVALNAGVPAVWFNHDMRTKELCEYHGLPNIKTGLNILDLSVDMILKELDYSDFLMKYAINRERLRSYLSLSGVEALL